MKKITILVVDDEALSLDEIGYLLRGNLEVEIIGYLSDFNEAVAFINNENPDVVLLDINLGEYTGFDLLEKVDSVPHVIFITAYDEYAIKAFEFNAIHYLLKPVTEEQLRAALKKVEEKMSFQNDLAQSFEMSLNDRVFIKDNENCYFVELNEIYLIESMGNYSRVFFRNQKPLLHKSLNLLETKLPQSHFFRANRSQIINFKYVVDIIPRFKSRLSLNLSQGITIDLSSRQSVKFRELNGL